HPAWWLLGWLLLGVAASVGAVLSAGVLHAAARDVYEPRFRWLTPLPRFSVNTDDAWLEGPDVAIDLGVARIVPIAALCAFAAVAAPSLSLPLFCGLLWSIGPLPGQPGLRILRALHHSPTLATSRGRGFPPNRRLLRRLRRRVSRENLRFAGVLAGYSLPWLLLVAATWMATTERDPAALLRLFQNTDWPRVGLIGGAAITA